MDQINIDRRLVKRLIELAYKGNPSFEDHEVIALAEACAMDDAEVAAAVKGFTLSSWAYKVWKKALDGKLIARCGMSSDDLPDWDFWAAFNAGTSPEDAAEELLQSACNDMGFDFDDVFGED